MKPTITVKELQPLADLINDMYDGDLCTVKHDLGKAIYMLHHVQEHHFKETEIQNVCFTLDKIGESLHQAYEQRQNKS